MTRPTLLHPASLPDTGRAQADTPPDRIFLRNHVVEAEIGAFQAERGVRQRVRFAIVADLAPYPESSACDDVDTILSYDVLLDAIRAEMTGRRINLLETLAEGIAARVLAHGGVAAVHLAIEKLDRVPGTLGVEITRTRPRAALVEPLPAALPAALPDTALVALLDAGALAAEDLSARLDALVAQGPTVLCVDAPGAGESHLPAPVQRRLDLLAFEQAAWRLAARDPRCVVVDSRTELDWGLRNGQVSVWAPSKIVVDARDDTPPAPLAMAALAPWLARRLAIGRLARLGAAGLDVTPLD